VPIARESGTGEKYASIFQFSRIVNRPTFGNQFSFARVLKILSLRLHSIGRPFSSLDSVPANRLSAAAMFLNSTECSGSP